MKKLSYKVIQVTIALLTALFVVGATSSPPRYALARQPESSGVGQAAPRVATGTGFTYQGRLKDGANPANGQYDLQFKLYDAASSGNQVGSTSTQLNKTVTDGLFTVQLDFGASAFGGDARWLEIAVRSAGGGSYTTLDPRQPLTAVPYAMSLATGSNGAVISGTVQGPALVVSNTTGVGVQGTSADFTGVVGSGGSAGVVGVSDGSINSYGVLGASTTGTGVLGHTDSTNGYGVRGTSPHVGVWGDGITGVWGSGGDTGIIGDSVSGDGVVGFSESSNGGVGVRGQGTAGTGVTGYSENYIGVYGSNGSGTWYGVLGYGGMGVRGEASVADGVGTYGYSPSGYGIEGVSPNGWAGWFNGNVNVTGSCCAAAEGSFKIDHPLDPENKYLVQSAVQSADMMSIYNGNATTDAKGEAVVSLPVYVEALNKDFRYQLTIMGDQFAQARVSIKIKDNHFTIKTDKPNIEVSWQVTGVRKDPYAQAHPIQLEVDKPADEKGKYLHPELYGQPESKGIGYEDRQRWQQASPKPLEKPKP